MKSIVALLLLAAPALAQPVQIRVDANASQGAFRPIYSYFGYDEPNFTYTHDGAKLIHELGELSPVKVQIRAHHLLVTGDGAPAMKWGSTNAYTVDANGKPVYDWTIVDKIFDTYEHNNARPFVEIGFMPEALSRTPEPYVRHWPKPDDGKGWAEPPKDYAAWGELIYQWVRHEVDRYGKAEVEQWSWELWNEPDIFYWRGTPEEYDKLYDYTADALKRALPTARIGGPGTTNPSSQKAGEYLRQFLEHCANGTNAVTGKKGTPLDFITFHAKGAPRVIEGHVRMGLRNNLVAVQRGLEIMSAYPNYLKLPVVLSESDPEGCAACSAKDHPENRYRNDTLYATYTADAFANIVRLSDKLHGNIAGMLTWAFEFEDKEFFEGFRTLATNGIDLPVLNFFRMAGQLGGNRVALTSSAALGLDAILQSGVHDAADIDGIATRNGNQITALLWNYHDDDLPGPTVPVHLTVQGVGGQKALVEHFRIDHDHSNAFTVWNAMGSPQKPTPDQYKQVESAGQLQLLTSPSYVAPQNGAVDLTFDFPRQSLSLVRITLMQ